MTDAERLAAIRARHLPCIAATHGPCVVCACMVCDLLALADAQDGRIETAERLILFARLYMLRAEEQGQEPLIDTRDTTRRSVAAFRETSEAWLAALDQRAGGTT